MYYTDLIDSSALDAISLHSSWAVSTQELGVCHFSAVHSLTETRIHFRIQAGICGKQRALLHTIPLRSKDMCKIIIERFLVMYVQLHYGIKEW